MDHVRLVLHLLSDAGVMLKLKECVFSTDTIDYLVYIIRGSKL